MLASLVEKLPANALLQTPRKVHTRPTEKPDRRSGIFRKPTFQILPGPVHVEDFDRMHLEFVFIKMDQRVDARLGSIASEVIGRCGGPCPHWPPKDGVIGLPACG